LQEYPQFNNVALNSLGWSKKVYKTWYGMCYKFKNGTYTIYINRLLCSPLVSEEAIKYLIYHELLHSSGLWNHGDEFREEWSYPNSAELDGELDEIALRYNFDFDKLKKVKFEEIGIEKEKDIPLDLNTSNEPKEVDIGETPNKEARTHKYCRECGNKLPIKAKFCDVCGELTDGY